ncbi:unnamed protein product [Rhodiola kirilowii]
MMGWCDSPAQSCRVIKTKIFPRRIVRQGLRPRTGIVGWACVAYKLCKRRPLVGQ